MTKTIDHHLRDIIQECRERLEQIEMMPAGMWQLLNSMLVVIDALRAKILIMEAMHGPDGH